MLVDAMSSEYFFYVDRNRSDAHTVPSGVADRLILGPTPFIIYTFTHQWYFINLCADDIQLYYSFQKGVASKPCDIMNNNNLARVTNEVKSKIIYLVLRNMITEMNDIYDDVMLEAAGKQERGNKLMFIELDYRRTGCRIFRLDT